MSKKRNLSGPRLTHEQVSIVIKGTIEERDREWRRFIEEAFSAAKRKPDFKYVTTPESLRGMSFSL